MAKRAKVVGHFDFYEGDRYYMYWRTEKCYMMQWGFCSQHVMMPARRISKKAYDEAHAKYHKLQKEVK